MKVHLVKITILLSTPVRALLYVTLETVFHHYDLGNEQIFTAHCLENRTLRMAHSRMC